MNWQARIDNYNTTLDYPNSLFIGGDGRVVGTWIMGQNYTVKSKYHGGYPAGYLKRIMALFPDKKKVLHVCSGMVDTTICPGDTVDINPDLKPTFLDDAQTLENVPVGDYDLVMADPPYTDEDANRYGTTMVSRNKIMRALGQKLRRGAHVVWLDQAFPMYRKADFELEAEIGMMKSTNHRFRMVVIWRKL